MFHRVILILLIVSSHFLNLIAAQVVFSRTYNKTTKHRTQDYSKSRVTRNKTINKGK